MYLACGETPRFAKHFLQKRRLYVEIFGYNIECEEVTVYAAPCHRITVAMLMRFTRSLQ